MPVPNVKIPLLIKAPRTSKCADQRTNLAFLAIKILKKEKPDLIISSGAAVAVPFFYIGKLMGAKTVYIEVFDRINKSTLTGKLVYPITDKFIVQWEEMKTVYPKSINLGSIF